MSDQRIGRLRRNVEWCLNRAGKLRDRKRKALWLSLADRYRILLENAESQPGSDADEAADGKRKSDSDTDPESPPVGWLRTGV